MLVARIGLALDDAMEYQWINCGPGAEVLLLNQSPVRVITNLLIFENRTKDRGAWDRWKASTPATKDDRFRMVQMIFFQGFLTHRFSNFLGSLHDQGFLSQKRGPEDIGFVLLFPNGFTYECGNTQGCHDSHSCMALR